MAEQEHIPKTAAPGPGVSYLEWGAIFGGAAVAGALATVLSQFGAGIGLAASHAQPTQDGLNWALFLIGLWLILVAFASASAGGYVAGRMRSHFGDGTADESEFRDGIHGIVVWALSTLALGAGAALISAISSLGATSASGEMTDEMMRMAQNASVVTAFGSAAGAVLAAAGSWFAGVAGGKHRDEGLSIHSFVPTALRRKA
ncbi:hypothetical protein [Martelella radicis]|uniref:Uncharacterized protein n=1 Tax=Martelella radicis TaxID=1397476 RepID=A0A7W6KHX5_9HYPH|nr:hypothetical protein [Martelella radicis]MBB4121410.1 hypothetical protein [Martelella radicis]